MSRPVNELKNRAVQKWPGAVIISRERNAIIHKHPTDNRYMLDVSMGAIHYGPGQDLEINTDWEPDAGAWDYKMVLADFNAHARSILNSGNIVEYSNPYTLESITFQPLAINWVAGDTDSRQQLALPQAVAASVSGDTLNWVNGYGNGIHFRYITQTERLQKLLIIDAPENIPAPESWLTGPLYLEIEFIISYTSGVDVWVDGLQWDKSTKVQTGNYIEFRDANGSVNWYLDLPRAYDSNQSTPNTIVGEYQLRRQGNNFYITVRVPKAWVDTATYPIMIDPTVTPLVAASADDAMCDDGGNKGLTGTSLFLGVATNLNPPSRTTGLRFILPSVTNTDNIDLAYIEMVHEYGATSDMPIRIIGDAQDNAPAWVVDTTFASETTYTTNFYSTHVSQTYSSTAHMRIMTTSQDISAVVEEITSRAGWSAGNGIRFMVEGYNGTSTYETTPFRSYDASTSLCARLHVEYSSGGTATDLTVADTSVQPTLDTPTLVEVEPATPPAYVTKSTQAETTGGTLNVVYTSPTSGNLLVLFAAAMYGGDITSMGTPSGWTLLQELEGGLGTTGNDRGTVQAAAWYKIADGTEGAGTVQVIPNATAIDVFCGLMVEYSNATGAWEVAATSGLDESADTSWSVTGAGDPGVTNGDILLALTAPNANVYSDMTAQAVTQSGVAFSTGVERHDQSTALGGDMGMVVSEHAATAGTSAGAPTFTGTMASSGPFGPAGPTILVRIREGVSANTLTVADASVQPTLDVAGVLAQVHNLVVADTSVATALDAVAVSQTYNLAVSDASVQPTLDTVATAKTYNLTVADTSVQPTLDAVTLSTVGSLAVADTSVQPTLDAVALTQLHNLTIADTSVQPTLDAVTLDQAANLIVADLSVATTLDAVDLTQAYNLAVADASVQPTLDTVTLSQLHNLAIADTSVQPTLDTPVLNSATNLTVADTSVATALDTVTLSQLHSLAVADTSVQPTLDTVAVGSQVELVVADTSVATALDAVALAQLHNLAVVDLSVATTLDVAGVLAQVYNLAVADLSIATNLDAVELSSDNDLTVASLSVRPTVDAIELFINPFTGGAHGLKRLAVKRQYGRVVTWSRRRG